MRAGAAVAWCALVTPEENLGQHLHGSQARVKTRRLRLSAFSILPRSPHLLPV